MLRSSGPHDLFLSVDGFDAQVHKHKQKYKNHVVKPSIINRIFILMPLPCSPLSFSKP